MLTGRSLPAAALLLVCACASISAQQDGPLPPRLQIPGAIAVGPPPRARQLIRQQQQQQQQQQPQQRRAQAGRAAIPVRQQQQAYLPTPSALDDGPTPPPQPIFQQARPSAPLASLPPRPVEEEPEEYDDEEAFTTPQLAAGPTPAPAPVVSLAPIFRTAPRPPPQLRQQDPPPQFRQQVQPIRPQRPVVQVASPVGISISDIPVSQARPQVRQQPTRPTVFRPERPIIPAVRPVQQLRQQSARPAPEQEYRQPARPAPAQISEPPRQQFRQQQVSRPVPVSDEAPRQQFRQQPARPAAVLSEESRPQFRQQPAAVADEELVDVPRQQFRQQPRPVAQLADQQVVRGQKQPQQKLAYSPDTQRQRKPVAQTVNKYREDNPDGSITWGYENDDGSFKEETIGVDCVVSGKYGYVDPDGMRREYKYSSGIPCDKAKEQEQQEQEGYMDYQNNEYVLPNGQAIDFKQFSNHKSRRPAQPNYGK